MICPSKHPAAVGGFLCGARAFSELDHIAIETL